jgi:hypothetical protein
VSLSGLARVWSFLGSLLALYAAGTWIILQGGKSFAELPGLEGRAPVTSAYEAVLIIGLLLGIVSVVGLLYMRKTGGRGESLLPVVGIADTGPHAMNSASMRVYQAFFVLIFLVLPAAALYKLNHDVIKDGVFWHDGDPALSSISFKNGFGWTQENAKEYGCSGEVMRADDFTWLANRRCDIVKANDLKPFKKTGLSPLENIEKATNASNCVRDLANDGLKTNTCENVRDISEECEKSERHCRGIQWFPFLSPFAQVALTAFGWGMVAWLLLELSYRKLKALLFKRPPDMLVGSDVSVQS